MPEHRVVALALPNVVAFDLAIPGQVFGHPEARDRYRFDVAALHPGVVTTSTGFGVAVEHGLEALQQADTVVVPGFHPPDRVDPAVVEALTAAAARGARIVSICIGAFALAAAGLLDGLPATTHWQEADRFRALFPRVRLQPDVLYVDAGDVLTSAGLSAGIDLCIHLVRRDHGAEAAAAVARRMVVAVHRSGGQLQYVRRPVPDDGGLQPTREWALAELQRPLTVQRLADHAGLPVRSFSRRFAEETGLTPMRWLADQRVREAQRLLEATAQGVDQVADLVGFGSAATLRLHLGRVLGTTPSAYRAEHRAIGRDPRSAGRPDDGAGGGAAGP